MSERWFALGGETLNQRKQCHSQQSLIISKKFKSAERREILNAYRK